MTTNTKILYAQLSYDLHGLFFEIHNELGRYCREKQYADALDDLLKKRRYSYRREQQLSVENIEHQGTNVADFVVNDQIVVEIKAKKFITKDDYYQVQRYLQASRYRLGLLVNFRDKYLKAKRIVRIDTKD